MDKIQEQRELAVGEAFIKWYNQQNGTEYRYHGRGDNSPDCVYRFRDHEKLLEITAAYYDADYATMLWQNARDVPGAPDLWTGSEPDQKLIKFTNSILERKSSLPYPPGYVLVVGLYPDLTTAEQFAGLIPQIKVPADHPFAEIYLSGEFPASSSGSRGGYYCWKLA